jgi:hypothetical protein
VQFENLTKMADTTNKSTTTIETTHRPEKLLNRDIITTVVDRNLGRWLWEQSQKCSFDKEGNGTTTTHPF